MKMEILALTLGATLGLAGCMYEGRGGGCCESGAAPMREPAPRPSATLEAGVVYRCPHDGATRATPGPCPKCGMTLDEQYKVSQ